MSWGIVGGPIASISPGGLATATAVYQNTTATVSGDRVDLKGVLDLTVLNVLPDNFGSYAGDTIDDAWQVFHFGLDNPLAAPGANPDGDPNDNLFEFLAKLDPKDGSSFLHLELRQSPAYPNGRDIIFWPVFSGCTYTVARSASLAADSWDPLASPPTSETEGVRTVTDVSDAETRGFYHVEVANP